MTGRDEQCGAPVSFNENVDELAVNAPQKQCRAPNTNVNYGAQKRPGVMDNEGFINNFNRSSAMLSHLGGDGHPLELQLDSVENTIGTWQEDLSKGDAMSRAYETSAINNTSDEGPTGAHSVNVSDNGATLSRTDGIAKSAAKTQVQAYSYKSDGTDVPMVDVASNVKYAGNKILPQVAPMARNKPHEQSGDVGGSGATSYAGNVYGNTVTAATKMSSALEYLKNLAKNVSTAFVGSNLPETRDSIALKAQENANLKHGGYSRRQTAAVNDNVLRDARHGYKNADGGNASFSTRPATGQRADWQAYTRRDTQRPPDKVWWDVFDDEAAIGGKKMPTVDPIVQSRLVKKGRERLLRHEHDNVGKQMSYAKARLGIKDPKISAFIKDGTHEINKVGRPGVGGTPGQGVFIAPRTVKYTKADADIKNVPDAGQRISQNALHSRPISQNIPVAPNNKVYNRGIDPVQRHKQHIRQQPPPLPVDTMVST